MRVIICLVVLSSFFASCKKNKFKRSEFLQEFYDYKIDPELKLANDETTSFLNAWDNYLVNQNSDNLNAVKGSFNEALYHLDQIQFYNLGEISQTYIYNKFNKASIDTIEMWNFYDANSIITENDVASLANPQKGFYAVEYLLFAPYLSDSLNSAKYRSWINGYISDISSNLSTLKTSWGVYQKNFTENLDDGVDGSFNIVCNRIIHSLEDIIDKRINPVLLSGDIKQGVGHFSDNSLGSIKRQVQQLNDVYLGNGTQIFNSVHNYLRKKKKKLAEEVKSDFEEVISYQNGLSQGFEWYLNNDIQAIETYKQMLTDILVKFKLDVTSAMGIVLTFGDTDGD